MPKPPGRKAPIFRGFPARYLQALGNIPEELPDFPHVGILLPAAIGAVLMSLSTIVAINAQLLRCVNL